MELTFFCIDIEIIKDTRISICDPFTNSTRLAVCVCGCFTDPVVNKGWPVITWLSPLEIDWDQAHGNMDD